MDKRYNIGVYSQDSWLRGKRRLGIVPFVVIFGLISIIFCKSWAEKAYGDSNFFSIQVASYKNRHSAIEKVKVLKQLGHNAFFRQETIRGKGPYFRVYIERFPSRSEAVKEAGILKRLGLISDFAVRALGVKGKVGQTAGKGRKNVFYLHIGSFKQKENSEKQVRNLVDLGYKAFFVEEEISGSSWFRVYIGEFDSEAEANKAGSGLMKKNTVNYFKILPIDKGALIKGDNQGPKQ